MKSSRRTIGVVAAVLAGCFGVALAVAAPQPPRASVRGLAPGEAAGLTGGLCHDCVDCESYRANCVNLGVNNCPVSCSEDEDHVKGTGTVTQKCVTSGPLAGGCGPEEYVECLVAGDWCRCTTNPPNWVCSWGGNVWLAPYAFKRQPCP